MQKNCILNLQRYQVSNIVWVRTITHMAKNLNKGDFMKKYLFICLGVGIFVIVLIVAWGAKCKYTEKKIKADDSLKKAYLMGYAMGQGTSKNFKTKMDKKAFKKGMKDGFKGKKVLVSQEDIRALQEQEKQKSQQKGATTMLEGKAFLKENSQKEGVKVTPSGLQYKVLREGQGQSPKATDTVEVHYRGTLTNGQEFDSSYKRNQSISFPLNGVIKGWTEGLQLMQEGAKYEFYIPSELAYGARGAPPKIPPHSVLIFEVELIKVK